MRISDGSSDVCSSDLFEHRLLKPRLALHGVHCREQNAAHRGTVAGKRAADHQRRRDDLVPLGTRNIDDLPKVGRVERCDGYGFLEPVAQSVGYGLAYRKSVGWGKRVSVGVDLG